MIAKIFWLLFVLSIYLEEGQSYQTRNCKTELGRTCTEPFKYRGKQYASCTEHGEKKTKYWCYTGTHGVHWDYCTANDDCIPKIDGDTWHCNLFPNWPNYWVNMGTGKNFCGRSNRRYPECDPQLPPVVSFYGRDNYGNIYKMGIVDMKESIETGTNAEAINIVRSRSPQGTMLVYIVHGFTNNGKSEWIYELTKATFKKYQNYRIVVAEVDWGWGANNHLETVSGSLLWRQEERQIGFMETMINQFYKMYKDGAICQDAYADYGGQKGPGVSTLYRKSAANTVVIGSHLGNLAAKFTGMFKYCIGHSLGGQICGFVGKSLRTQGGLDGIVAMDPAGPIFEENDSAHKLAQTDAKFVQALHTNTAVLGHKAAVGHVDYYINKGEWQPSCGKMNFVCSHGYSHELLTEIYNSGGNGQCADFGNFFPKRALTGSYNVDSKAC